MTEHNILRGTKEEIMQYFNNLLKNKKYKELAETSIESQMNSMLSNSITGKAALGIVFLLNDNTVEQNYIHISHC